MFDGAVSGKSSAQYQHKDRDMRALAVRRNWLVSASRLSRWMLKLRVAACG